MTKVICLVSLAMIASLSACAVSAPASESESTQAVASAPPAPSNPIQPPRKYTILPRGASIPVGSSAGFCFPIYGPCNVGTCEEPNESYQDLTEVCCSDGICTNEYYRQCGSCNAESSGPCTVF